MKVVNIVFLGHKDHGKSTLIGNLLMQTGSATQARVNEAKQYSKKLGKAFEPAFILDSFVEEREHEMTYDTTRAEIKYKNIAFAFIDVPGHEELIKNMISGASYAAFAVVLVSAKPDEGIRDQTKRHIFLARMMGIRQIIIAVNKMDTVHYDKTRFERMSSDLSSFLERIGFKQHSINFVPISAYNADNLLKPSKKMPWYVGNTLLETMYGLASSKGIETGRKGLRLIVQGIMQDKSEPKVVGKVVSGSIRLGQEVKILPSEFESRVKSIFVKGRRAKSAKIGQNVALSLSRLPNTELRGSVIAGEDDKINGTTKLSSIVFFTEKVGKKVVVRLNGVGVGASLSISRQIDVTTGITKAGRSAEPLGAAEVNLELDNKTTAEPFGQVPELGRFVLYSKGRFAGIGIIEAV